METFMPPCSTSTYENAHSSPFSSSLPAFFEDDVRTILKSVALFRLSKPSNPIAKCANILSRRRSSHDTCFQRASPSRPHKRRGLLCWAALDLFGHCTRSLRDFNAGEMARLDTAMWRSYYAKQRLPLFFQLTVLLCSEYHLPWLRSQWVAYQAAKAALIFKEGQARNDYEKALPYLHGFYSAISAISDEPLMSIVLQGSNWSGGSSIASGRDIRLKTFRNF